MFWLRNKKIIFGYTLFTKGMTVTLTIVDYRINIDIDNRDLSTDDSLFHYICHLLCRCRLPELSSEDHNKTAIAAMKKELLENLLISY